MTLDEKLKQAASRAADISAQDDRLVTIKLRDYGYLVEGQRDVGDKIRQCAHQLLWETVDLGAANTLLAAVEAVDEKLGQN